MGVGNLFAHKKIGALHFFVEYHKLNAVAPRDSKPIPCMDVLIDSLGDGTVLSTLDDNRSYGQIEVAN